MHLQITSQTINTPLELINNYRTITFFALITPNLSTPEVPVSFQKCLTINLCDLYQCKHTVLNNVFTNNKPNNQYPIGTYK